MVPGTGSVRSERSLRRRVLFGGPAAALVVLPVMLVRRIQLRPARRSRTVSVGGAHLDDEVPAPARSRG
ncbi:hypothetical protein ACLFMI_17080 [Pseudonocardia nantongensis]|uniref:hypothetical protein n=1 Tax=Pseudonocardia nantongensis TaxID=1181885 RepID=UPI003978FF0B